MSGHSKWSTIKRKKAVTDNKRGQVFTKMAKIISVAAREGGPDPITNFKLRLVMDKAREVNMPGENIERAIARGAGTDGEAQIEQLMYEGYGPGGIALLIEVITDNKNRTLGEVRHILDEYGGKLGTSGSVTWMFERLGAIRVKIVGEIKKDDLELELIDLGAADIKEEDGGLVIYCDPKSIMGLKKALEQKSLKIESAEIEYKTKNPIKVTDDAIMKKFEKLMEALDEHDDVNEIYSNIEN